MDHDGQNIQPEGFDAQHVSYLLDSAELAEQGGNLRLAIHLYCAAFEASQETGEVVDERTLSGLRQAWILACEQGDRSTAETIFNDLIPYNSDEQTQAALMELQDMAMGQLGVKKDDLEGMALAFADEMRDAGIDIDGIAQRFEDAQKEKDSKIDLSNLASLFGNFAPAGATTQNGLVQVPRLPSATETELNGEEQNYLPSYANLPGFDHAKEHMRVYGIIDPADTKMQTFLKQAESFHGVSGPVLTQNFLFVGPSREDTGFFAHATANEIGWPVVTMTVDVNEMGDGTIKVMAPVKRSFFGPPRITDLPNPCILVIQNIDILQDLFWNEEQSLGKGGGAPCEKHDSHNAQDGMRASGIPMGMQGSAHGFQQRSFQSEMMSYLSALFSRGGVFVMATSSKSSADQPLVLSEQLESLLGRPVEIPIDLPTLEERRSVLAMFSNDHPSFHDLDNESLARLSEGLSRYELYVSCGLAVEAAYSDSLKEQKHHMVTLEDVLDQFIQYLPQDSRCYSLVEDYLVSLFSADLEKDLLSTEQLPAQISLDLAEAENDSNSQPNEDSSL